MHPFPSEASLIAIASVSAVFWTGGLIVMQLRADKGHARATQAETTQAGAIQSGLLVQAGMALFAFGALSPLFAILATANALRVIALVVGIVYFIMTYGNLAIIVRPSSIDEEITALGFFLPTACMFSLVVFPFPLLIAWESLALDLLAYYILSALTRVRK